MHEVHLLSRSGCTLYGLQAADVDELRTLENEAADVNELYRISYTVTHEGHLLPDER